MILSFEPRPPLPMKGKAEPLPVFAVTGERQQRAIRLQEPTYALPMVGRQQRVTDHQRKIGSGVTRAKPSHRHCRRSRHGQVAAGGRSHSICPQKRLRRLWRRVSIRRDPHAVSGLETIWSAFFDVDPICAAAQTNPFARRRDRRPRARTRAGHAVVEHPVESGNPRQRVHENARTEISPERLTCFAGRLFTRGGEG